MTSTPRRPRTFAVWLLFVLLLVQAAGAVAGGIALVAGPQGEVLQMPVSMLEGSPFDSYLVPGLVLLLVLGVLPLAAAVGLWLRRPWAWWAAGVVGCGLLIWIVVQVSIVDYHWLQPAYGAMGALILLACLPHSVRRYAGVSR